MQAGSLWPSDNYMQTGYWYKNNNLVTGYTGLLILYAIDSCMTSLTITEVKSNIIWQLQVLL